ncbi:CPBP family intramembrane glutamic endopeptidase [Aestuariivirga sp.]|uniref:CPBP family intramembrane glutamic endopeptidase n=1 Tax=Aestuariivirga sp. TaxID=2650926 RepID=UPI0025BC3822|nr:CPBP family intramembrane glutamic endopeptidase [Aestuariivirga sp.]MCA3554683.1 CPBP family intramembrane metalloprotease [Aestuariivirga sp.]
MRWLGEDFSGGFFRRLYAPSNPAGLWYALMAAAALLSVYLLLPLVAVLAFAWADRLDPTASHDVTKLALVSLLPVALLVAGMAWWLANLRGGRAAQVLSLRRPQLGWLGWVALVVCFMLAMYAAISAIAAVFDIDGSQYTPGPDGQSPKTGSAGTVKEAMFDLANEPWLFALVFPSVTIGASLAEEAIFRGQLFSALSQTRLGVAGATLLTALMWSLLHFSETWLSIGLIFVMGLIFGYLIYRFGSLWVTIACHGIWNGLNALLIFFVLGGGP